MTGKPENGAGMGEFCWRDIGTSGDSSCEKLKELVHCRNCSEYARAAASLFQRPATAESLKEYGEAVLRPRFDVKPKGRSVLVFRMCESLFALPASDLASVIEPLKVRRVPHLKDLVSGIAQLEGVLRVCIRLDRLLCPEQKPLTGSKMVLVNGACPWVFVVDEVIEFIFLADDVVRQPPGTADERFFTGFFAAGGSDVMLVDLKSVEKALSERTGLDFTGKVKRTGDSR